MTHDPLIRAWGWLIGLSAVSTALAVAVTQGMLTHNWVTAVILRSYLGLAQAPFWNRGFSIVLGFYALLLLALYLMG